MHDSSTAGLCTACGRRSPPEGRKLCSPCSEARRLQARAQREKGLALGICIGCARRPRKPGRLRCQFCLDRATRHYGRRKARGIAEGLCHQCARRPKAPGRQLCERCLAKHRATKARRQAEHKTSGACSKCGAEPALPGRRWGATCTMNNRAWRTARFARRKAAGCCGQCGQPVEDNRHVICARCRARHQRWEAQQDAAYWRKVRARERERRQRQRDRLRAQARERRRQLKLEVLQAYGGRCVCCGETQPEFLTLDHIHGDGKAHRERMGMRSGTRFYALVKAEGFPDYLQLLCYNCNIAKGTGDRCPHAHDLSSLGG